MKKLDLLSILGVIVAFGAILGGNYIAGGQSGSLWELTALVVVLGGTVGAILLQTPLTVFLRSIMMLKFVFISPISEMDGYLRTVLRWNTLVRREGLLGLEAVAQREKDAFTKKALQLLIDGNEPKIIQTIMEVDLLVKERNALEAARMYESMGGYAPTIGILGAVLGLIHVMDNLADPEKLGEGIATAFVATIYGVGLANLLFLPIANKLKVIANNQIQGKELLLDGILSIAAGENARNIESKLRGYLGN